MGEDDGLADILADGRLTWWPEIGVGYYPVTAGITPYDQDYFNQFAKNADSDIGRALMRARCDLVEKYYQGRDLVDVGIGSGAFIDERSRRRWATWGYDVNPTAVLWLDQRRILVTPYLNSFAVMTMWDVLEHIPDFRPLVANVRNWLFLSLPIFDDADHVLRSKHFKPAEHCWYFTHDGLVRVLADLGFDLVEHNKMETELGREDIGSFVFRRADCAS